MDTLLYLLRHPAASLTHQTPAQEAALNGAFTDAHVPPQTDCKEQKDLKAGE